MFITVDELKAELPSGRTSSDERLILAITKAQAFIERATGLFFDKQRRQMAIDGNGRHIVHLPHFCMAIESLSVNSDPISPAEYILYNTREDRDNPKIFFGHPVCRGHRNVIIDGYWGYVDVDTQGNATTPPLIKKACLKIAVSEIHALTDPERREFLDRERVIAENTDGHSYTLANAVSGNASFTGDQEIDSILLMYQRPLQIGAV